MVSRRGDVNGFHSSRPNFEVFRSIRANDREAVQLHQASLAIDQEPVCEERHSERKNRFFRFDMMNDLISLILCVRHTYEARSDVC